MKISIERDETDVFYLYHILEARPECIKILQIYCNLVFQTFHVPEFKSKNKLRSDTGLKKERKNDQRNSRGTLQQKKPG